MNDADEIRHQETEVISTSTDDAAETGTQRDYIKLPATASTEVRFTRIEETLEISAPLQESTIETVFSAFEAIESLTDVVTQSQASLQL